MATIGKDPVWFITGCSTGFGRELADLVLSRGGRAVVTARDPASLDDFVSRYEDRALAVRLDVTKPDQIENAVLAAEKKFGRIDVLVNNAGYGYLAAVEDGDEGDYRAIFETNVFGMIAMIRAVLPGMRARRQGHLVNLSSIMGFIAMPSTCFYAGSKFAVEGISEAMAGDLGPLGISVTMVEPSGFRTDFAGRSIQTPQNPIADYAETVGARIAYLKHSDGQQPGDPKRAAAAIIEAVHANSPPLRLLLGEMAIDLARQKLDSLKENFDLWESVTRGADSPKVDTPESS